MLELMGLVHMNGRLYDPRIGRFISADPFIQNPGFAQSFNRYSYVWNNPVSFVDPSGYKTTDSAESGPARNEDGHHTGPRDEAIDDFSKPDTGGNGGGQNNNDAPDPGQHSGGSHTGNGRTGMENSPEHGGRNGGWSSGENNEKVGGGRKGNGDGGGNSTKSDRVTITKSVNNQTGMHTSRVRGLICSASSSGCDSSLADKVFSLVNSNDVPFSPFDDGSGLKILMVPAPNPLIMVMPNIPVILIPQPIQHYEDIAGRSSMNETIPGHIFHPGTVTHRVHFEDGNLYYDVDSVGSGLLPGFNNLIGVQLFRPGVQEAIDRFGIYE